MRYPHLLLIAAAAYAPMARAGLLLTSTASEAEIYDLVQVTKDCAALKASPKFHITRLASVDLTTDHAVLTMQGADGSAVQLLRDFSYPDVMEGVRSWDEAVMARPDEMWACWSSDAPTPWMLSMTYPTPGDKAGCLLISVPACLVP